MTSTHACYKYAGLECPTLKPSLKLLNRNFPSQLKIVHQQGRALSFVMPELPFRFITGTSTYAHLNCTGEAETHKYSGTDVLGATGS